MSNPVKRLFFDIETSPMIVASWSLWPDSLSYKHILRDFKIICAAWMWEHEGKVRVENWQKRKGVLSDYNLCRELHKQISQADEIVYHNGDKFDFKKLHTRLIKNNLEPLPYPSRIDTLKQAKKHFKFSSNRLDYLGEFLEVGSKHSTSFELWLKCMEDDRKALNKMIKYCKQDVKLLVDVYKKLRPFIDINNSNHSYPECPKCSQKKLQKRGFHYTKVSKYQRYQCLNCKSWCSDRDRLNANTTKGVVR